MIPGNVATDDSRTIQTETPGNRLALGGEIAVGSQAPETTTPEGEPENAVDVGKTRIYQIHNHHIFNGTVNASDSQFGMSTGISRKIPTTGVLDEQHVSEVCRNYVRPEPFEKACNMLRRRHILFLEGTTGVGKYSGAICLLREMTGKQLNVLSPLCSPDELKKQSFVTGLGYLVYISGSLPEMRLEFFWNHIRQRVHNSGAWLVVMCSPGVIGPLHTDMKIVWERPTSDECLHRWLELGNVTDASILLALESRIGDDIPVDVLRRIVDRVKTVEGVDTAIEEEIGEHVGKKVELWFSENISIRIRILEIATLVFLSGTGLRQFEEAVILLNQMFREEVSDSEIDKETDNIDHFSGHFWAARPTDHELIQVKSGYVATEYDPGSKTYGEEIVRDVVTFRSENHLQHALRELWNRMDSSFWNVVRQWLTDIVTNDDSDQTEFSVAVGIAHLAMIAPEEVSQSYFDPWSKSPSRFRTQTMAARVLAAMASTEKLSLAALRVAHSWELGTWRQQWAAALAFAAGLSVVFPGDGARCLIRLIAGGAPAIGRFPAIALASVFEQMTFEESTSCIILDELAKAMQAAVGRRHRDRLLHAIAEVLAVRHHTADRSAVFSCLVHDPSCTEIIASLAATTVNYRPTRRRIIDALLDGIADLEDLSTTPEYTCRQFATALAKSLASTECGSVIHDIRTGLLRRKRLRMAKSENSHAEKSPTDYLIHIALSQLDSLETTGLYQ